MYYSLSMNETRSLAERYHGHQKDTGSVVGSVPRQVWACLKCGQRRPWGAARFGALAIAAVEAGELVNHEPILFCSRCADNRPHLFSHDEGVMEMNDPVRPKPVLNIECSWCGHVMVPGVPPTSHGICDPCARKTRDEYEAQREHGTLSHDSTICVVCRFMATTPVTKLVRK